MLNNLKIRNKMILAFVLIGLFSTIVGAFGLYEVSSTNKSTEDIYSGHFIPTTYLFEIQKNMMLINNNYDLMIYEKDIIQAKGRLREISSWSKQNADLMAKYEEANSLESGKGAGSDLYEKLKKDLEAGNEEMKQMNSLLEENNTVEAMNLAPNFHARINLVNQDIENLIQEEINIAQNSLTEARQDFQISIYTMSGIAILCLLLAIAAGTVISRRISEPIVKLAEAAEQLSEGNVQISVQTDSKDEIGDLVTSFARMTANIKEQAEFAHQIAEGNLDMEIPSRSEQDVLGISMKTVISVLKRLVDESEKMTEAALQGNLAYRGTSVEFSGGYYNIIEGFNQTLEAVIQPLNTSAENLRKISKGDIPDLITEEYYGDFNEINEITAAIDHTEKLAVEIARTSTNQASAIVLVNKGIEQVSLVIQNNSATAEQSAAASQQLNGQADLLMEMVHLFQTEERIEICPEQNHVKRLGMPEEYKLICC